MTSNTTPSAFMRSSILSNIPGVRRGSALLTRASLSQSVEPDLSNRFCACRMTPTTRTLQNGSRGGPRVSRQTPPTCLMPLCKPNAASTTFSTFAVAGQQHGPSIVPERNRMPENGDQKSDDRKTGPSKRLARNQYDRLVRGVDDIFFGGVGETEGEKKPLPEKSASEPPKSGDGDK